MAEREGQLGLEKRMNIISGEGVRPVGRREAAIELLLHRAGFKDRVVIEGPPGYLRANGHDDFASQDPTHPAFVRGWSLTLDLRRHMLSQPSERGKVRDAILMDDFHNIPPEERGKRMEYLQEFLSACPFISDYPLNQPTNGNDNVLWRWESDYLDPDNPEKNRCSNLDAKFQGEKVLYQKGEGQLIDWLRSTVFVVVHPTEFKDQQLMMVEELARAMRQQPFFGDGLDPALELRMGQALKEKNSDAMKNRVIRSLLSELYCHVWLDPQGEVESITRPLWNNGAKRFEHQELPFAPIDVQFKISRSMEQRAQLTDTERRTGLQGILHPEDFGLKATDAQGVYTYQPNPEGETFTIASLGQKDIKKLEVVSDFMRSQWEAIHPEATGTELITVLDMGGVVFGVYNQSEELVGATQVLAGFDMDMQPALITDQTAVVNTHQALGVGKLLKQVVFLEAAESGISRIYVTFDPRRRNLWGLNVGRLGGKVIDFVENKYGGGLQGVFNPEDLPTDRVVGLWDLLDPRTSDKIIGRGDFPQLGEGESTVELDYDDSKKAFDQRASTLRTALVDNVVYDFDKKGTLYLANRDTYLPDSNGRGRYRDHFGLRTHRR